MLPPLENATDPGHPLAVSLLFHDVPPIPVYQLPYSALLLNPAPGIKFWDDFGVQHAPSLHPSGQLVYGDWQEQ